MTPARLRSAKAAYTTRHVDLHAATHLLTGVAPRVSDLVLAKVAVVGQHPKIELAHGRRAAMFVGDEIVVAYGCRYAPDVLLAGDGPTARLFRRTSAAGYAVPQDLDDWRHRSARSVG